MSNNPTQSAQWKELVVQHAATKSDSIEGYFKSDHMRAERFSLSIDGLLYDFSKTQITEKTGDLLLNLAHWANIPNAIDALFKGEEVNSTENKAALHTKLRSENVDLSEIETLSEKIRAGQLLGATGKPINHIVHIGLGGSDLGPRLVYDALLEIKHPSLEFSFLSNADGTDIKRILKKSDPETTLFIIVSKSFTTHETLMNAKTAQDWLHASIQGDKNILAHHFIGVTAYREKAIDYGLSAANIITFDDNINGRFSVWSTVGLSLCIAFGIKEFKDFLSGASAMDMHFKTAPLDKNIPCLMALVDIWHRNFNDYRSKAILPYAEELKKFPSYLRQLEMESNGKSIDLEGQHIHSYQTSPIVFGEVGTNSQHSFFQLLHQGTNRVPCEFIGAITANHEYAAHHIALLNNMLAQSQALMQGKESAEPHRRFAGNRPSTTLLLNKIDAFHLGMLIALYEHKVYVQSVIWNINCFDQFGVELGKEMALKISQQDLAGADGSTTRLHRIIKDKQSIK